MTEPHSPKHHTELKLKKLGYSYSHSDHLGSYYLKHPNLIYLDDIGIFHYLLTPKQRIRLYGSCHTNINWNLLI